MKRAAVVQDTRRFSTTQQILWSVIVIIVIAYNYFYNQPSKSTRSSSYLLSLGQWLSASFSRSVFAATLLAYLPSYMSGAEYHPKGGYWRPGAQYWLWRHFYDYHRPVFKIDTTPAPVPYPHGSSALVSSFSPSSYASPTSSYYPSPTSSGDYALSPTSGPAPASSAPFSSSAHLLSQNAANPIASPPTAAFPSPSPSASLMGPLGTIDPSKQYIICSHPHGVLSLHHGLYMTSPEFDSVFPGERRRHVNAPIVFWTPLLREWLMWSGGIHSNKRLCNKVLQEGYTLVSLLGGVAEQTRSKSVPQDKPAVTKVYVRRRKGMFELALRHGVPIIPSYGFGETNAMNNVQWGMKWRSKLSDYLNIPFCLPYGRWFATFPHPTRILCVLGQPIPVTKIDNPTLNDINALQAIYIEHLKALFNKYKAEAGYPLLTLEIE